MQDSGLEKITILLNGSEVAGHPEMTILELAQENGIYIPTLCHDLYLKPVGACRVCLVEDQNSGNLIASCVTPIASGMKINTESEKVIEARRTVVKLLLAGHPDSCIICDKGNSCQLRKIASELGIGYIEFDRVRRYHQIESANPFIERDLSKCIMCGKCVRGCQEIEEIGAIDYANRGFRVKPSTALNLPLEQSICEFCGLCVSMCPVGALTDKLSRHNGRSRESIRTVCPYCGVGCNIYLNVRDQKIVSVSPAEDNSVNRISLCVKGRYGYDFINSPERLTRPLIRIAPKGIGDWGLGISEIFREATWEEALSLVASKLTAIKEKHGATALAGIGSYRCTNEDNYLLQKFFRAALGSNNIDNGARSKISSVFDGLEKGFGIEEIENSDVILIIGSDITESHPIAGQKVKRAVKVNGARSIVIDQRDLKISRFADMHLRTKAGTDVALINGLINVIINEGLYDKESANTDGLEELKVSIQKYTPENVEDITGVRAEDIRQAARLFAGADRASIISGTGITHNSKTIMLSLINLALLTGNIGKESSRIYYLIPHNNLQGACDTGIMPDNLPGYQKLNDLGIKKKFEREWGVKLPENAGLTAEEMLHAAKEGKIKGMYIVGDNLVLSYPDKNSVIEALKSVEFLVVQDIFMSETAELADVVLPAASFAEKDGTFTNTDRRIQRVRKALEPVGQAMPDWAIIAELSTMIGYPMKYESPEKIMDEIAHLTPIYSGISYERLEKGSLQWLCPDKERQHRFTVVDYMPSTVLPATEESSMIFNSGTGTMTKRSVGLRYLMELSQFL